MKNNLNSTERKHLKMSNQESKAFTRRCIKTAFLHLMKHRSFDEITITSIIEKAGVSRAGFYRNYSSKEEILEEISLEVFQNISDFFSNEKFVQDPYQRYLFFFTEMQKHSDMLNFMLYAHVPREKIFELNPFLVDFFANQTREEHYRTIAIWFSLKEIMIDWLSNGMKDSPEDMAKILAELFPM